MTPIGSQTDIAVDVRVVATTNRNMPDEIRAGKFREDLYYRLNVFPLNTVALADRIDDIVPVATFLLHRHVKSVTEMPGSMTARLSAARPQLAWQCARAGKCLTAGSGAGSGRTDCSD